MRDLLKVIIAKDLNEKSYTYVLCFEYFHAYLITFNKDLIETGIV